MKETWSEMTMRKKKKLLFLSFILSFIVQLLYLNVNYEVILGNRSHHKATVSQTEHMDVQGNVYTVTENTASIYFEVEGNAEIAEVLIKFQKPFGAERSFVLYSDDGENTFLVKDAFDQIGKVGEEWLRISLTKQEYEIFRLDILHGQVEPILLENIFCVEESLSFWEEQGSKISVVGTLFFWICLFLGGLVLRTYPEFAMKNMPFVVLWLVFMYILPKQDLFQDDVHMFVSQTRGMGLWEFSVTRFLKWSSRQVIEGVIYFLVKCKFLWAVFTSLLCVLSCLSLSRLVGGRKEGHNWFLVGLFLLFPFGSMSEAGWIATSTNYFWVIALGVFSLLGVRDSLDGKVVSRWQLLLGSLATIYAANQEQGAALLVGFYLVFFLYFKVEKISIKPLLLPFIISFCSLIYHLVCPGNYLRKEEHRMSFFPDFDTLSLGTKVEMAYSSTLYALFIEMNVLFAMLCLMMVFVAVLEKDRRAIACMVAPVSVIGVFAVLGNSLQYMLPWFREIKYAVGTKGTEPSFSNPLSLIPLCIITICLVSFLCGLYYLFQDKKMALFQVIVFLAGLASRIIMGFSPTIWLSGHRTFIFLYFCLMVITLFVYQKLYESGNEKYLKIVKKSLVCAVIYSVLILIQTPFFVVAY